MCGDEVQRICRIATCECCMAHGAYHYTLINARCVMHALRCETRGLEHDAMCVRLDA